jgi:hypothetical protein
VRGKSSAVLLALAVATLAPSLAVAQYVPKWHMGDWWVVKTWGLLTVSGEPEWSYTRYAIVGDEKVRNRDCYVLEIGRGSWPSVAASAVADFDLCVRKDDWMAVREVVRAEYDGKSLQPITRDYPHGLSGPFAGDVEPRLPRFPLNPGSPDTAFKNQDRDDCSVNLREISSIADPALVKRLLAEGDTANLRVVRPTGVVYEVREEMGGNLVHGPLPGELQINQSLQLWCEGQPWRLYEEYVQYEGKKRYVTERSWLIASNRAEK